LHAASQRPIDRASQEGTLMRHAITRAIIATAVSVIIACGGGTAPQRRARAEPLRLALLMDTLQQERWQHDRDLFTARAKERGADVLVEAAEGDAAKQLAQSQSALEKGVKV